MNPLRKFLATLTPPLILTALMLSLVGGAVIATPARAASIVVNTTTDEYGSGAGCSLREAIRAANTDAAFGGCSAGSGADTITLPAGTYTLTLVNSGGVNEDNNATGDLDVLSSLTIQGAGSGTTIIQSGTNNSNGIDKVLALNPICASSINVTIDGVTIRYGQNTQPAGAADFSFTGGGVDWCDVGAGGTFNLTNSVISDNTNVNGYGGGLNIDTVSSPTTVNITNVTFTGNRTLSAVNTANGGGINIFGDSPTVNITNSTFTSNLTTNSTSGGGAVYFRPTTIGHLTITGSTFTTNTAAGIGGAIATDSHGTGSTISISNSTFTGNHATNSFGGALYLDGTTLNTTPFSLTHLKITGNTAGNAGGGLFVGNSNVNMSKSLIVGNTATLTPSSMGLRKSVDAATATVENNWWGCSTGPSASPCDTASTAGGTLDFTPWYRDQLTATTSPIVTNQSTSLTASFLTNSAGSAVPVADLAEIIGRSVTWAATNGNLSGTQSMVQGTGTATGSFQATSPGTTIISAKVDNDNTAPASSNILSLTINKANTTASITNAASLSSAASVTGQLVTVTFSVTGAYGNSPTAPTGNVTVSDGTDSCTASIATGQCDITFKTAGAKTITTTYAGDTNFNASPASASVSHTVNKADTTTITSDTPDPSVTGGTVTFNVTVAAVPPGVAVAPTTITGSVTVSDGSSNLCIATLTAGAGSCTIDFPAAGPYSMTGVYGGDANFNGSTSSSESHQVDKADTTTTITLDNPDSSVVGTSVTVNFSVTVNAAGAGTPTGNVTVSDGVDSCTASATSGTCNITLTTIGARTLTATYVGDSDFNGSTSAGEPHTVSGYSTTTTITLDSPDPSVVGQTVTVQFSVTSGTGTPTGNVTISDGVDSCTGTVAAGQCAITFNSAGAKTLTATYAGDATHEGSVSAAESHQVNKADTTTTITSDSPDPSAAGQLVTVNFSVLVSTPGSGTPTGNVTVSDGVDSCTVSVASGACSITLTTGGPRTLTATYAGDSNFNGSTSAGESHIVDNIAPDVIVNQASGQADPTTALTINFTAVFTELVIGFGDSASDVALGGTAGANTVVVTEIAPNDGTTYNVAVSGMIMAGLVTVSIPSSVATDGVGNPNNASTSTDNIVAWAPDTTPPDTTIDSNPANPTIDINAAFTFSGTDDNSAPSALTFECQLDGGGFSACTSPQNYNGLGLGFHTFDVRAIDEANNVDPTPATYTWEVVNGPTATIVGGVCGAPASTTGKIKLSLFDPEGDSLALTFVSSSNTTLVSNNSVKITGRGTIRTVVVTGKRGVSGVSTITLNLSDGVVDTPIVITYRVGTTGDDTLEGTSGIDIIIGLNGDDVLNGYGDSDLLCGGNGNDTLNGGDGNDILSGSNGNDTLNGGDGDDLMYGQNGVDTFTGGPGADSFFGGAGLDVLIDFNPAEGDLKDNLTP